MLYIGLYSENIVWNHKAYNLDIWSIASPSGPLPSLFKLCPWGQKWPRPGSHMLYIGLHSAEMRIFRGSADFRGFWELQGHSWDRCKFAEKIWGGGVPRLNAQMRSCQTVFPLNLSGCSRNLPDFTTNHFIWSIISDPIRFQVSYRFRQQNQNGGLNEM